MGDMVCMGIMDTFVNKIEIDNALIKFFIIF